MCLTLRTYTGISGPATTTLLGGDRYGPRPQVLMAYGPLPGGAPDLGPLAMVDHHRGRTGTPNGTSMRIRSTGPPHPWPRWWPRHLPWPPDIWILMCDELYLENIPRDEVATVADQRQHDVYGEILDCAYQWAARRGEIDAPLWGRLAALVEASRRAWRRPDHGIWEVRTPGRPFTYSAALCQVALNRGARLARRFNLPANSMAGGRRPPRSPALSSGRPGTPRPPPSPRPSGEAGWTPASWRCRCGVSSGRTTRR
jgi:hypothetical protein